MQIKYLMDENLAPIYQRQLRQKEPDLVVWAVGVCLGRSIRQLTLRSKPKNYLPNAWPLLFVENFGVRSHFLLAPAKVNEICGYFCK